MTSPVNTIASSGITPPTTRMLCATWGVWTSDTFQVSKRHHGNSADRSHQCACSNYCCWLHRNREAREGVHTRPGWTLGGGSLQLWRAGGVSYLTLLVVCCLVLVLCGSEYINGLCLQLMHPVLESLRNTDKQWLIDTLYAFNAGNVEKFQSLKSAWGQQVGHLCNIWNWCNDGCIEQLTQFSFHHSLTSHHKRGSSCRRFSCSASWRWRVFTSCVENTDVSSCQFHPQRICVLHSSWSVLQCVLTGVLFPFRWHSLVLQITDSWPSRKLLRVPKSQLMRSVGCNQSVTQYE